MLMGGKCEGELTLAFGTLARVARVHERVDKVSWRWRLRVVGVRVVMSRDRSRGERDDGDGWRRRAFDCGLK